MNFAHDCRFMWLYWQISVTSPALVAGLLLGFRSGYSFRPPASIPPKIGPRGPRVHMPPACNRAGLPLATPRPHIPAMPFPTMPDPAADRAHEQARRHPERETLELATAGAAQVLGVDHGVTKALARAALTMAKADLWLARIAIKTLRRDQREAIAEATENEDQSSLPASRPPGARLCACRRVRG